MAHQNGDAPRDSAKSSSASNPLPDPDPAPASASTTDQADPLLRLPPADTSRDDLFQYVNKLITRVNRRTRDLEVVQNTLDQVRKRQTATTMNLLKSTHDLRQLEKFYAGQKDELQRLQDKVATLQVLTAGAAALDPAALDPTRDLRAQIQTQDNEIYWLRNQVDGLLEERDLVSRSTRAHGQIFEIHRLRDLVDELLAERDLVSQSEAHLVREKDLAEREITDLQELVKSSDRGRDTAEHELWLADQELGKIRDVQRTIQGKPPSRLHVDAGSQTGDQLDLRDPTVRETPPQITADPLKTAKSQASKMTTRADELAENLDATCKSLAQSNRQLGRVMKERDALAEKLARSTPSTQSRSTQATDPRIKAYASERAATNSEIENLTHLQDGAKAEISGLRDQLAVAHRTASSVGKQVEKIQAKCVELERARVSVARDCGAREQERDCALRRLAAVAAALKDPDPDPEAIPRSTTADPDPTSSDCPIGNLDPAAKVPPATSRVDPKRARSRPSSADSDSGPIRPSKRSRRLSSDEDEDLDAKATEVLVVETNDDAVEVDPARVTPTSQPEDRDNATGENDPEEAEVVANVSTQDFRVALSQSRSEPHRRRDPCPSRDPIGSTETSGSGLPDQEVESGGGNQDSTPTRPSSTPADPAPRPSRRTHRGSTEDRPPPPGDRHLLPAAHFAPDHECIPDRQTVRPRSIAEVEPWTVEKLNNLTLMSLVIDTLFPALPLRSGWIFPYEETAAPSLLDHQWRMDLLTEENVKALDATRPWEVLENSSLALSFDPNVGGRLGPFLCQYLRAEERDQQAFWESTHSFPITKAMCDENPWFITYRKGRINRRGHAGRRWKMCLVALIYAMQEGWCDLDILLDLFFLHFPRKTDRVTWYPGSASRLANLADPNLQRPEPTDLLEALDECNTADPWRNHCRDDPDAHPAHRIPRLAGKFIDVRAQDPASL